MNIRTPGIVLSLIAFGAAHLAGQGEPAHARRQLMDLGWAFHLGNEWGIGQNMAKAGQGGVAVDFTGSTSNVNVRVTGTANLSEWTLQVYVYATGA